MTISPTIEPEFALKKIINSGRREPEAAVWFDPGGGVTAPGAEAREAGEMWRILAGLGGDRGSAGSLVKGPGLSVSCWERRSAWNPIVKVEY